MEHIPDWKSNVMSNAHNETVVEILVIITHMNARRIAIDVALADVCWHCNGSNHQDFLRAVVY